MKWIIFVTSEAAEDGKAVSAFLKNQKAAHELFHVSSQTNCDVDNSNELKKMCTLLCDVTHCILLYKKEMDSFAPLLYAAGYCAGKEIPVFVVGLSNAAVLPAYLQNATTFKTVDKMHNELTEKFHEFRKLEEKKSALKKLFDAGIPFTPDSFSFHLAQSHGEECNLFLTAGMDVNCRDSAGTPMVCIAARAEKKEMITWLIENGADIDAISDDRGYTAVMDAVWRSNFAIAELLVKLGAGLDVICRDGQPILVLAVGTGNIKICELLVKHGANKNLKDKMGMSAAEYARLFKKEAICALFDGA